MAWNEAFERIRARMHNRMYAYQALFVTRDPSDAQVVDATPWWAFWRKPKAGSAFTPAGEFVLKDLARYCHVATSSLRYSKVTGQGDALATAFAEGQRDVFNRIVAMCNLNTEHIERIAAYRSNEE